MLTLSEAISQRRSIRSFLQKPVPQELILQLLESARLAPSASNRQPWRFFVVTDEKEKAQIRKICLDQAFIEEAGVVFICCVDLNAYSWDYRKKRAQELVDFNVAPTLSGRFADPAFSRTYLKSEDPDIAAHFSAAKANTFIAVEHMALAATALGLGSCWVGAFGDAGEIENLFGFTPTTIVVAVLAVGYPTRVPGPRPRLPLAEILLRPLAGQ